MKIGIVSPYNIFKGGGVQECVFALQNELARRGHDAYIITPQPRDYRGEAPAGVIFVGGSTDFKSPFHTTAQVSVSVNNDTVDKVLADYDFDILHFHEPWVPVVARQILSRSNTINVATFHAKLPDTVMSRTIEMVITPYTKSIIKYLDAFTAVSQPAAEYISGLDELDIRIIPNGIDQSKYKPARARDEKYVLYVGRLEKRKGLRYLLQAFALLKESNPELSLKIAGDGPDRRKLLRLAAEYDIDNVHFMGYVSDADKIDLMRHAYVFCSPALYGESFGIVLLEAIACGVPVVAGDNPGYETVMRGTGSISLVNPRDTADFARRLSVMVNDEGVRALWKKWAKDYIVQFDYVNIVDRYEALYNELYRVKT